MYFWVRNTYLLIFETVFGGAAVMRGGRPTHLKGVGGAGRFVVHEDLDIPAHPFFRPGRVFRVYQRHGNVANDDDGSLDIRGAAMKFHDLEDPDAAGLDLIMNTGEVTFSTARVFLKYAIASGKRPWSDAPVRVKGLRRFLNSDPRIMAQYKEALRRAPDSYAGLHYYSKVVYAFKCTDGARRFARFRIRPPGDAPEHGIPTAEDLAEPWEQERLPGDARAFDFARRELGERLSAGAVHFELEAQIWEPPDGDIPDARFDPGAPWTDVPWSPIGSIHLTRRMSASEAEQISYNLAHMPTSLGFLESFSIDDFHSIPAVRIRVYRVSKSIRSVVFWWRERANAGVRQRDQQARGSHGLDKKDRRDSSLWDLIFSHMRR